MPGTRNKQQLVNVNKEHSGAACRLPYLHHLTCSYPLDVCVQWHLFHSAPEHRPCSVHAASNIIAKTLVTCQWAREALALPTR